MSDVRSLVASVSALRSAGAGARLIGLVVAVLAVFATASEAADATSVTFRVEVPKTSQSFMPRRAVDLDAAKSVTVGGVSCDAGTAIAVLNAATDGQWRATKTTTSSSDLGVAQIGTALDVENVAVPAGSFPTWVAYVDGEYAPHPCTTPVPENTEVLFYPQCQPGKNLSLCFGGGPLYLRFQGQSRYPVGTTLVGSGVAIGVVATEGQAGVSALPVPVNDATLSVPDEGTSFSTYNPTGVGLGSFRLAGAGDHTVVLSKGNDVPDRAAVCATNGADGYCGTTLPTALPFDVNQYPADCTTNGHDGLCGTTDTSGPGIEFTGLTNGQVFAHKSRPKELDGTIDADPNGAKSVQMRLTRVVRVRVAIKHKKHKPKHKHKHTAKHTTRHRAATATAKKHKHKKPKKHKIRYRTVKRCTYWSDATYLMEKAKHCGTQYGQWFAVDMDDPPTAWHYAFGMKLPPGTYTVEMQSKDFLDNTSGPDPTMTRTFVVR